MRRMFVPCLVPVLVVLLALPSRAEPSLPAPGDSAPASGVERSAASRAEQNGLRSCLFGGCLCGGGQCANGEPVKAGLFAASIGTLAVLGGGLTLALANPPAEGDREPRAGQLAALTVVNLSLVAVWVWSLVDAYAHGRERGLEAGPARAVVETDEVH